MTNNIQYKVSQLNKAVNKMIVLHILMLIGFIWIARDTAKWIANKSSYAYWFCWGMYQRARFGGLPKVHYAVKDGQWRATWHKRT